MEGCPLFHVTIVLHPDIWHNEIKLSELSEGSRIIKNFYINIKSQNHKRSLNFVDIHSIDNTQKSISAFL